MKTFLLLFGFIHFSTSNDETRNKLDLIGRYCVRGDTYLSEFLYVTNDNYCGFEVIEKSACVSITTPNNHVKMGCDNDEGFSDEPHLGSSCSMKNNKWICYCNKDNCNDCRTNGKCHYPEAGVADLKRFNFHLIFCFIVFYFVV